METLAKRLKEQAHSLGFELVGIAPAVAAPGAESLGQWLAQGFAGEMHYMTKRETARQHPQSILPDVRSVVMVAMNYRLPVRCDAQPSALTGRISCYAQGDDYHEVMWSRLNELLAWLQQEEAGCRGRAVVDTAPLLERDFARLAGLGWFGKNTMLLHKRLGSYFFLGALLLNLPLPADAPFETAHCGTCTACLDACPTQAFVGPGQLDARRCISYLTIELRRPIPEGLRPSMGDWIFGCDVCQEVCPWNRKAPLANPAALAARDDLDAPDLLELVRLSPDEFRRRFRGTALTRARRRGLLRNAAIALGNRRDLRAIPALIDALQDDEPLVRGAAAWALGCLPDERARAALRQRRDVEKDVEVRQEIDSALRGGDVAGHS
jgi:epoxyqueuosine reductase